MQKKCLNEHHDVDIIEKEIQADVMFRMVHNKYISPLLQNIKFASLKNGDENSTLFH